MMMPENYYRSIINGQHTTELPDYRIRIIKSDRTTTELNEHYIGITNTDHMTELKEKFKRMCEESMRRKQHMHLIHDEFLMTERLEIMSSFVAPSLACRQDLVVVEVPSQGREATVRTIKEWSQYSTAKITDLFYVTTPCINLHDSHYHHHVTKILGLHSSVKMHHQRSLSSSISMILRHAKHFAENNRTARVLVVNFHGLSHTRADHETAQALYVKDLQRKNRDYSVRLREAQGENDRLRAKKLTLVKRLGEVERGDNARGSRDSSTSGSHRRRSSASTQVPKRELFLSLSY